MYTYIYIFVYMNVYINPIPVSSSRWHSKKELPPVDFQHFEAAFARFRGAREVPRLLPRTTAKPPRTATSVRCLLLEPLVSATIPDMGHHIQVDKVSIASFSPKFWPKSANDGNAKFWDKDHGSSHEEMFNGKRGIIFQGKFPTSRGNSPHSMENDGKWWENLGKYPTWVCQNSYWTWP